MSAPPKRYVLLELEEDLSAHHTTWSGVCAGLRILPGVKSYTDLAYVSQTTLDVILLQPTERVRKEEPAYYKAIRNYHQRRHQLDLPGMRSARHSH